MILSTRWTDFRSLKRLDLSSPRSSASIGLLSLCLLRFKLYSWHFLRGSIDGEDNACGPLDSFISKSCAHCTQCSLVSKYPSILMGENFFIIRVQQLVKIDHSYVRYVRVSVIMLDSNNHYLQSFDAITLSVISNYGIYFLLHEI